MTGLLAKLYAAKARVLEAEQALESVEDLTVRALSRASQRRSFHQAVESAQGPAIVAELKRASPSAGLIAGDFDLEAVTTQYELSACDAISVLTESDHFLGELAFLDRVRGASSKPVLRKDFLWTRYQVVQSVAYGADALLLIVAGLTVRQLQELLDECTRWNIDALVEVHDRAQLQDALACGSRLIGINNRNLQTFKTDLRVTEALLDEIPSSVTAISESGFHDATQIAALYRRGARGFLIGEALMRSSNPPALIDQLKSCAST